MDPWSKNGADPWTKDDGRPQEGDLDPLIPKPNSKKRQKEGTAHSDSSAGLNELMASIEAAAAAAAGGSDKDPAQKEADPWAENVDPWSASSSSSAKGITRSIKDNGSSRPIIGDAAWSKFESGSSNIASEPSSSSGEKNSGSKGGKGKGKGKVASGGFGGKSSSFNKNLPRKRGVMTRSAAQGKDSDDTNVSIWDVCDELLEVFISGGFLRGVAIVFVAALTFRVWMLKL